MEKSKRLKIGIFMDSFYPAIDGVVLVIDNLAKMLAKTDDVVLVVPKTESETEDFTRPYRVIRINSIHVPLTEYQLGMTTSKNSKTFKKLLAEKFDIIHIHSPFSIGKLGVKVARALNVPVIATMHTRFDFEFRRVFKNETLVKLIIKKLIKVYNDCDACIAINKAMIKVFKDYGYQKEPVVIYNGTDLLPLKEKEKYLEIVNKLYDLKDEKNVFLFVGRLTSIKNIFFILDSLKILKAMNVNFKMLFVGTGPDEKMLENKIKDYKLQDNIIMTGRITDRLLLSAIYARSDLFLFPSLFDASSLVQIEAAVNETPGLFIEGSVTSDTIINNVSGFTTTLDTQTYAKKIREIIENPKHLKKVSTNAKMMLGKNWQQIALETKELYLKEIAKKGQN